MSGLLGAKVLPNIIIHMFILKRKPRYGRLIYRFVLARPFQDCLGEVGEARTDESARISLVFSMPEVALEQVGKDYPGGVRAVDELTLTVAAGELVVLVGPSGCGKTTTMRLIAGLETPTHGLIRLDGKDAQALAPSQRDVAMVFQRPAVYPHLTVRQNLAFGMELRSGGGPLRRLLGWIRSAADIEARVAETAELLSLTELLPRYPGLLSGGQQQRVALGRALVRRASLLLLDEPLASLDLPLRRELRCELHLLHRRFPATMIHVTHDPLEALSLGDRVAVLDRGRLQQVDTPEAVYHRPVNRFVAGFFSRTPTNFFDGWLVLEEGELSFRGPEWRVPLPAEVAGRWRSLAGRPITLGLRAEDVEVADAETEINEPGGLDAEARAVLVEPLGQGWLVTLAPSGEDRGSRIEDRGSQRQLALRSSILDPRSSMLASGHYYGCQRPGAGAKMEEGRKVRVRLHLDRAHLFDRASGAALASGE
jgi:ABC-type sugar transport system ATPase subunit